MTCLYPIHFSSPVTKWSKNGSLLCRARIEEHIEIWVIKFSSLNACGTQTELIELMDLVNLMDLKAQVGAADKTLEDVCGNMSDIPKIPLRTKKILKGHLSKVTAVHYCGDNRHLVSGSLDGKLIIWDTWSGNKVKIIPLQSSWVMTASYSPSGNFVACGGMDNMCTVYDVNSRDSTGVPKIRREMMGFEGFLSCCRFLDDNKLITGSADMKIMLWDLEKGVKEVECNGHAGDVISMSLHPDKTSFVTGSVDRSIKVRKFTFQASVS
ncbi:guanine nucleotide-binding protein subunit beta-2 [Trichonephila clavipes]|nr:guanine nucleotide-binding protein subunit beta-2 [Trichonephila clavipes]